MNDIETLRTHLFATLDGIKNGSVDVDKAKAINEVSQTIINTAKAEIDFAKVNGSVDSQFFIKPVYAPQLENKPDTAQENPTQVEEKDPFERPAHKWDTKNGHVTVEGGVTRHKMK